MDPTLPLETLKRRNTWDSTVPQMATELGMDGETFTYVQHGKKTRSRPGKGKQRAPPSFEELMISTTESLNQTQWPANLVRALA